VACAVKGYSIRGRSVRDWWSSDRRDYGRAAAATFKLVIWLSRSNLQLVIFFCRVRIPLFFQIPITTTQHGQRERKECFGPLVWSENPHEIEE
jgi:hypothetical protein